MLDVNLICHAWDLLDEGVDEVLARLHGELGVTGVCVPAVCAPLATIRTRKSIAPRIFRTRGGLFFAPQDDYYQATRCTPAVSTWLKGRNPLRRIADGCRKIGLDCRAVVACSTAGRIVARHPHAAAKTVFGDPWPDRLCPINPDAQALLIAVCRDLSDNYGLSAIELAELHPGRVGGSGQVLDTGVALGSGGEALLHICFCESCRQLGLGTGSAGEEDVDAAARSAEVRLLRILETGQPLEQTPDRVLADDPLLSGHVRAQWRSLAEMVKNIRAEVGCDLIVHAYDDVISPDADPYPLADQASVPVADGVLTSVQPPSGEDLEGVVRVAMARAGSEARAELQLRAFVGTGEVTTSADAPWLVRTLSRLVELGITSVNLDSYGQGPDAGLTGVKQAVRFARRRSER